MGGSNYPTPPSGGLPAIFAGLEANVAALNGSPNASYSKIQGGALEVTDTNGTATISAGEYTFTTGPWSGKTINSIVEFDGLGNPQIILGPQPDGTDGLGVYNQLGVKLSFFSAAGITQYDDNGNRLVQLGTTGLTMFDTTGNPRSITGLLPSGDYGLGVYPIGGGAVQEVLPLAVGPTTGSVTVSAAYTYVGGDVTTTVGASGTVLIRGTADLVMTTANVGVKGGIVIDGATGTVLAETVLSVSGGNTAQGTVTRAEKVTGLTPGSHTFAYYGAATTAGSASVFGAVVEVQPL